MRPPVARQLTIFAVSVTVAACGSADTSMPRDWRPLRLGAASGGTQGGAPKCPPVAGTYGVESELLFTTMIGQHLPIAARAIAWSAFALEGDADTALTAIVVHAREGADTMHLRRGVAYGCADGWLTPTFPAEGLSSDGTDDGIDDDEDEASRALRGAERAVFVAGANGGALVARLRTTTYRELPAWCGDGCRTVRIPFSAKSQVRWERQAPFQGRENAIAPDDPRQRLDPRDTRDTRETRATRRIRAALPPDVSLVGVTPRADGWRVSIDLRDKATLVPLLSTLNNTPGIADARVERAFESLNLEGSWHEVLWLRFTSR